MNRAGLFLCLSALIHLGMLLIPALPVSKTHPPQIDAIELVDSSQLESTSSSVAINKEAGPLSAAHFQESASAKPTSLAPYLKPNKISWTKIQLPNAK